jgi:hypothetical protein
MRQPFLCLYYTKPRILSKGTIHLFGYKVFLIKKDSSFAAIWALPAGREEAGALPIRQRPAFSNYPLISRD